ncbi:hypothetical protein B0T14DRAFT_499363 [Immersiella caudata]|uniref:ABM domain-containing protein n=1 Tax=Immersiella caudata TaxID=314043 RepID=A0AA39WEP7_9PEZI|nr:hypothetical protein B0T14DRAFT_499363 [Immersiella caudata]
MASGTSLHVTIYIAPESVDKFFEHFKPVYDRVIAEPKCRFFEVYQSSEDPGTISWVEDWDATEEWIWQEQIPKDYYKPYFAATEPMFVKPREFKFVKRVGLPYLMSKDSGVYEGV